MTSPRDHAARLRRAWNDVADERWDTLVEDHNAMLAVVEAAERLASALEGMLGFVTDPLEARAALRAWQGSDE